MVYVICCLCIFIGDDVWCVVCVCGVCVWCVCVVCVCGVCVWCVWCVIWCVVCDMWCCLACFFLSCYDSMMPISVGPIGLGLHTHKSHSFKCVMCADAMAVSKS